jgi:hypothetical protein
MKINLDNLLNNFIRILLWDKINPSVGNSINSSIRNSIHLLFENPVIHSSIDTRIWSSIIDSIGKLNKNLKIN